MWAKNTRMVYVFIMVAGGGPHGPSAAVCIPQANDSVDGMSEKTDVGKVLTGYPGEQPTVSESIVWFELKLASIESCRLRLSIDVNFSSNRAVLTPLSDQFLIRENPQ